MEFKLEAGKFYRTRDGRKAIVSGLSPFNDTSLGHAAAGYIEGGQEVYGWHSNGIYIDGDESEEDLISEWLEPETGGFWVNVYRCPDSSVTMGNGHATREDANQATSGNGNAKRLACVWMKWTEGEGL